MSTPLEVQLNLGSWHGLCHVVPAAAGALLGGCSGHCSSRAPLPRSGTVALSHSTKCSKQGHLCPYQVTEEQLILIKVLLLLDLLASLWACLENLPVTVRT